MPEPYGVEIEDYCDRHFIKSFVKKHSRRRWELTVEAIEEIAAHPAAAGKTDRLDLITDQDGLQIYKGRFKIHGTNTSYKSSGNRFILLVNAEVELSRILLIYGKEHVKGSHETAWWKGEIKAAYPELKDLL